MMQTNLITGSPAGYHAALALVLLKCSKAAARAASEYEALQSVCDLLVNEGGFHGASIAFNQAGRHKGSTSNQCFLLKVEGQLLGALVISSGDAETFDEALVELVADWCETLAQLLAVARRRALHGRTKAWEQPGSDVEELRRTEAALRRSESFLGKAQRLSLTGSFSWTTSDGVVVWSDETFRIFGYEPARITPTLEHILDRVRPDDQAAARRMFANAKSAGQDFDAHLRLVMPDGTDKHVQLVVQALGCPVTGEFVGAVMDITAATEMAQAIAFRDQVMGILGHDLRNPLSAVLGIAGLARLDETTPAVVRDKMDHIDQAARRMREMIDTLLDYTQTRFAGRLPISPAATNLKDVCGRVVAELAAVEPERAITLEVSGDATGMWDPARIAQVVSNLVGNALTHGEPGAPVRLSILGRDSDVALEVHNRGRAIASRDLPRLFEPFQRGVEVDDRPRPRGLGLGLHIAKQIVAAHGGSISVRSSAGEGTTFSVGLPRA